MTNGRRAATVAGLDRRGAVALQGWMGDDSDHVDERALERAIDTVARIVEVVTGDTDHARARPPLGDGPAQ
jgi:hypothetical protein